MTEHELVKKMHLDITGRISQNFGSLFLLNFSFDNGDKVIVPATGYWFEWGEKSIKYEFDLDFTNNESVKNYLTKNAQVPYVQEFKFPLEKLTCIYSSYPIIFKDDGSTTSAMVSGDYMEKLAELQQTVKENLEKEILNGDYS